MKIIHNRYSFHFLELGAISVFYILKIGQYDHRSAIIWFPFF